MLRRREAAFVWLSAAALGVVLAVVVAACGGGSDSGSGDGAAAPNRSAEDLDMRPDDFRNLHDMTKVRGFFIDNRLGHLDEALAVANSPDGGEYPVGTIIQLVPQEAMVKRRHGFNPATNDWEFFFLSVSEAGTVIEVRGVEDVVNRFGGNCASCHSAADPQWDFVCEMDHGCEPLPFGHEVFEAIQESDPRPRLAN